MVFKGELVKIVDNMGVERDGLIVSLKYGYERWGGGTRFSVCQVLTEGRMETWKIGGTTGWSYRKNPPQPRRWCPNPMPKIISK